ncbi:MAG TPA: RNA methyltransferase [Stellaceae bacterium]|nr:RNA methyltransferase [Stellaceae bacterium]
MAGTDRRRTPQAGGPAIILVEPQLGENIGTTARAMFNCGLTDLRLVKPRDGWPNEKAVAAASGADPVLEKARVYARVEDAIAGLRRLYATTARDRYMVKRILTPRAGAAEIRALMAQGEACGILFGPERTGLLNEHIALADTVISAPLNPAFSSLNLAQAVLVVGYEWFTAGDETPPARLVTGHSKPATKEKLIRFFEHLEEELDRNGFMRDPEKRPSMVRNLRNLFQRAQCTEQELRTLHGVVTSFAGPRRRKPAARPSPRPGTASAEPAAPERDGRPRRSS